MIKIIITGPESTGKSTLAENLSNSLNEPFVPEYARFLLPKMKGAYSVTTLLEIAKGQIFWQSLYSSNAKKFLICDTGVEAIYIWHQFRFGGINKELGAILSLEKQPYYFLCAPDIPWVEDPLRETPNQRPEIFDAFVALLKEFELKYFIIEGQTEEERLKNAMRHLKNILN